MTQQAKNEFYRTRRARDGLAAAVNEEARDLQRRAPT